MTILEDIKGDVVVLQLKGNLMGLPETDELRAKVKSLLSDGFCKIVFDVGGLKWVNSAGLGAFIASLTSVTGKGGDVRMSHVTDKIKSLLVITQLIKVFKTFETTERAIASFVIDPIEAKS